MTNYNIYWDFGDLDCNDPQLQSKLNMNVEQIINADDELMHCKLCKVFDLPLVIDDDQFENIIDNGRNGFKVYYWQLNNLESVIKI